MIKINTFPNFYKCTNTTDNFFSYYIELLNKAINVFEWKNVPDNIDTDTLETILFRCGDVAFFKYNDTFYISHGNQSGEMTYNFTPEKYLVSNPYIEKGKNFNLSPDIDSVIIYNTPADKYISLKSSFNEIIKRTAGILSDNLSSLNCLQINTRVQTIVTADNSNVAKSAEMKLKDLYDGKPYSVITSNLASNINIDDKSNANSKNIADLIDLNNYEYAQYLHALGIESNENNKKSRMIVDELKDNNFECLHNLHILLDSRKKAVEKINRLFNLDISVDIKPYLKEKEEKEEKEKEEKDDEYSESQRQNN